MSLMRRLRRAACVLACALGPAGAASAAPDTAPPRAQPAQIDEAARDPAWLALLYYRPQRDGTLLSEAKKPAFFLAPDGPVSPRAELAAGLAAFDAPDTAERYACRFPARYEWLRERFAASLPGAPSATPSDTPSATERCARVAQWYAGVAGERISIAFASSFLENPSSTFGHTFLRMHRAADGGAGGANAGLLDPTINYAARTDARTGALDFVSKGLFGGFPGVADELPFYRRLRIYAEDEGRDVHEYDLALTGAEIRRVLLHTWEIRDGVFDYYFLHENCAYRTLALLDVARPDAGLLRDFPVLTVPVDTIRTLRAHGLVKDTTVWPAFPKRVRHHEEQLTPDEALLAGRVARGEAAPAALDALPAPRRAAVLQLAFEYASVLIDRDAGERTTRKTIFGAITNARLALADPAPLADPPAPVSPENGHDGALLAAGWFRHAGRDGLRVEYAAFQHTLTDPLAGYEPYAEITLLHPELWLPKGGGVQLRRIDWLVAQSTIPASMLFAPRAWRLEVATHSQPFADGEHRVTDLAYQSGQAWRVADGTVLALLPGAGLEAGSALRHRIALAGRATALLTHQGTAWSAQLELGGEKFVAGSRLWRDVARVAGEVRLARDVALAASASASRAPRPEREWYVGLKWHRPVLGR